MKRTITIVVMLLTAMMLKAQDFNGTGMIHSFGLGAGVSFADGEGYVVDALPEFGFGYQLDGRNSLGLQAQVNVPCIVNGNRKTGAMLNVFIYHQYEFNFLNNADYLQYEIGFADITDTQRVHAGMECGLRFNSGGRSPYSLGLTFDINNVNAVPASSGVNLLWSTLGLVLRVEI